MKGQHAYTSICRNINGFYATVGFLLFLSLCIATETAAQDFSVTTLGDYGNITVLEVTGNYAAQLSDGSTNALPRREIAKAFFSTHKDEYDFLVIFSNFDFQMPVGDAHAFYHEVRNDTQGIGRELFDYSQYYGSNGRLQGTIDMGNIAHLPVTPLESGFEEAVRMLAHEVMHRWGAYVTFKEADGTISNALIDLDFQRHAAHWNFLLDSGASVLYGNQWQDNGDGTFTSIGNEKYYGPLDLYLMGLYDRSQVPPMLLIDNPNIDPSRRSQVGVTIEGTPRYVSIDDIIAAEGERIPGPAESQKAFTIAFLFITRPGTFTGEELFGIENLRSAWLTRFSVLTDGLGTIQAALVQKDDLPTNPGITLPPVTPRSSLPDMFDGVTWLTNHQETNGSWMDSLQTEQRDTVEALLALKPFDTAQPSYTSGLTWLAGIQTSNSVYLARQIEAISQAGQDVTPLVNELLAARRPDGGWGSQTRYTSNPTDTSFALKVLAALGYSDPAVLSPAIDYLKSQQHTDGSWGSADGASLLETTANVLMTFKGLQGEYPLQDQITSGLAWLIQQQNLDFGFGNSPSTVYDTAIAILTLKEFGVSPDIINNAVNYLLEIQFEDGSWYESPYQTALAVRAIRTATVDPDLAFNADNVTITPDSIMGLPATVEIQAELLNLGLTDVAETTVVLYSGAVSEENKIGEQIVACSGQSSVTLTFSVTITNTESYTFYIVADPENFIYESNELNNTAITALLPESTYDFEILPADVSVSQNPVNLFEEVRISSRITNNGTMNTYNVQVRYFLDDPQGEIDIATVPVDIPAGVTVDHEILWQADHAGQDLPVTVRVDPFNAFSELSETNNSASTLLTVNALTGPNLSLVYQDISFTPEPVHQGGNVQISALIRNEGVSEAANIEVEFYHGDPEEGGELLGSQTIQRLAAGESSSVAIDWTAIAVSGERLIVVRVDPNNQIVELREDDNSAFTTLQILSLPDLAVSAGGISFSPAAPKEGDLLSIAVTVQNTGEQEASDVIVRLSEGSTLLGEETLTSIPPHSQAEVAFSYDTTGASGAHEFTLVVDPDNSIAEQDEDNNQASKTFGVQDADLWLTEKYISPNGDGVQEDTQFFFRLETPKTVSLVVLNEDGETVRTFSSAEFEQTTSGNVTWDGLNERGMVVDDGIYSIQILDEANSSLGSLQVVVDTNRSPLTEALGTEYLLENRLTELPVWNYSSQWTWLPDESGILYGIWLVNFTSTPSKESPLGIFNITPDGENMIRLGQEEWDQASYGNYGRHYEPRGWMSPDGQQVAISVTKANNRPGSYRVIYSSQLWIVDRDGRNLTLIVEAAPGDKIKDFDFENTFPLWSPDNQYIAYSIEYPVGNFKRRNLWLIKSDGSGQIQIESTADVKSFQWSPDSTQIAYVARDSSAILKLSDTSGNTQDLYDFGDNYYLHAMEWLDNQHLLCDRGNQLVLVDASGAGNHTILFESASGGNLSFAPNKQHTAYFSGGSLYIFDPQGNTLLSDYESPAPPAWPCSSYSIGDGLVWSLEKNRLAFIDGIHGSDGGECSEASANLAVIDAGTGEITSVPLSESPFLEVIKTCGFGLDAWLSDGTSIIGHTSCHSGSETIFVLNAQTGEILPVVSGVLIYDSDIVSAQENYLTFVRQTGVYPDDVDHLYALRSLLNLTADLRVSKDGSLVTLKGTAQDLNFEGYTLEYADKDAPDTWKPLAAPADVPVVNGVFTQWAPPYEGTFYVKLTVRDKAGNVAWDRKQISWGKFSSISNLSKSLELFSPNGDGIKDTVELHYQTLEPVHLEFFIYDEQNALVKTFFKDHVAPEEDSITWDGTDESGSTVPDGTYSMRVFDYEFFVTVDNTPPDAGLALGAITQSDFNPEMLSVDLSGYAEDLHFKSWVVKYGEGYNPEEWFEFREGTEELTAEKSNTTIATFSDAEIEDNLVGKRFQITSEDFAGNRSTQITELLEEDVIFYIWDEKPFDISQGLLSTTNGPTTIGLRETIREPLSSLVVQYRNSLNAVWNDAMTLNDPASGEITFTWDTSDLFASATPYWVRLNGVDIPGNTYYSNEVLLNVFTIQAGCGGVRGYNFIQDLTFLTFQVRGSGETDWTDIRIYDAANEVIPTGEFSPDLDLSQFENMLPGSYDLRMVGAGLNDKTYYSAPVTFPPDCPLLEFTIAIEYAEAQGCQETAPGQATLLAKVAGVSLDTLKQGTLTYSRQQPNGDVEVLKRLEPINAEGDITVDGNDFLVKTTVDTNPFDEGLYPVEAVLEIESEELQAAADLVVDRVLPVAEITYPDESTRVCPVKAAGPQGDQYVVTIEGQAMDNYGLNRYEFYLGDEKIFSSEDAGAQGELGVWEVTRETEAAYPLTLKVFDVAGNTSCFTTNIFLDSTVTITSLTANLPVFSPDGDGMADEVEIFYEIAENASIDITVFPLNRMENGSYVPDSTPLRTLGTGIQYLGGTGTITWDGRDDTGTVVPYGKYGIAVRATDSCGNENTAWVAIRVGSTISDDTAPEVRLDSPQEEEMYGAESDVIQISGSIVEENLDVYRLRYGSGANPVAWTDLVTGNTLPLDPLVFDWPVGRNDGIPDGEYTLSLYAKDMGGLEAEARVRVFIDNTPPEVSFTSPEEGSYVKKAVDIEGTVLDPHLAEYTVEVSEGNCNAAYKWAPLTTAANPVQSGLLFVWQALPPDGGYCLRLTAADSIGNSAETRLNVTVDTQPPAAPELSGDVDEQDAVSLVWTQNMEPDLAGYDLYKNDQRINTELITDITYLDQSPAEGIFVYTVKAVDLAGWESPPSNVFEVTVDTIGPDVTISSPEDGARVGDLVDIKGTAFSADDFKQYRVYIGQSADPNTWTLIRTSPIPISYGILTQWDTLGLAEDVYSIKLEAEDLAGNINTDQIAVSIDNTPPVAPVLLSAVPAVSNVTLTWQANTESDLAGYLLYRNGQLANASELVIDNLKPYLLSGTSYLDQNLPDGEWTYSLVAMDEAGNISDISNTLDVIIDTHAPKADIVAPPDGTAFEQLLLLKAESSDTDIASIQFQYKPTSDPGWIDLGSPVITQPYLTYLDPVARGLVYGNYDLRAVATDSGGQTDPAPAFITLSYTDLTAPGVPQTLETQVNGPDVALTWTANPEPDIDGYNIYRSSGQARTKVNSALVTIPAYQDIGLDDGLYTYEITAVDTYGNESLFSDGVSANIYTPLLNQPDTPTDEATIRLEGGQAEANSVVEIFVDTGAGPVSQGTTISDEAGNFGYDVSLSSGENAITARATDSDGNISNISNAVIVLLTEFPAAPQDLLATASGTDILLNWTLSPGPDLAGYNVYRESSNGWIQINSTLLVNTTYTDTNLSTGIYTYRVTAENLSGIEGRPSNEASANVEIPPSLPELFLPPVSQGCQMQYEDKADISGSADPRMTLDLYKDGIAVATTIASDTGLFNFEDVQLDPGENMFYVIGTNVFGTKSQPSETSCVFFDISRLPDLEVTAASIFFYPLYPLEEDVSISVRVRNNGQTQANDVVVEMYLQDAAGGLTLITSATLAQIPPGAEEILAVSWNAAGKLGTNTLSVVVDPIDQIAEVNETNNTAQRDIFVAQDEGLSIATTLDSDQYQSEQDVHIEVQLNNSGPETETLVEVWIEDDTGSPVSLLDTINTHLPYASEQTHSLIWNTGSTYAGFYRVHAVLKDGTVIDAEDMTPFRILPELDVETTLFTDKAAYRSEQDVLISSDINNIGQNAVIPALDVTFRIVNSEDATLWTEETKLYNLLPGITTSLNAAWNTRFHLPGDYRVLLEVSLDGQLLSSRSAPFRIEPAVTLTGNISVTPAVVIFGFTAQADYTINNIGNSDVNDLIVGISVLDPETQAVMYDFEETIDLALNSLRSDQITFSTEGYELKNYIVNLHYLVDQTSQKNVASTSFVVRDGTAPVVSILSPVADAQTGFAVSISAIASDDASGVATVEYQIDDGPWQALLLADIATETYGAIWTPTTADVGLHTISFRATDRAGNQSEPVSTIINVEIIVTPTQYTLTVEKTGTGTGTVIGDGIDCGLVCVKTFETDTLITLEAIPNPDSTFDGWSGAECSGTGVCVVTMNAAKTVTAIFNADNDGDGVPDDEDNCPNVANPGQEDADNDGSGDACDACPNDPNKTEPGVCGCGTPDMDSDGDGTPDCNDNCPNDPNKTEPGVCGCGTPDTDSDGDGMPDCNDNCPNDPNKLDSGICGCGIPDTDTDNDGTPDCNDECPNDPEKVAPGICGCGVADTDSDGDGTPDCNDNCPNDPDKTEPGECGCGTPDTDTDSDGAPDCNDGCPNDPDKTEPGICGCGIADTDSDGDGTPDCNDDCPDDPNNDTDGDGVCGDVDNCPNTPNPSQEDSDGDGIGDACEPSTGDVSLSKTQDFVDRGGNSVYWGDTISYMIKITNFFDEAVDLIIKDALSSYAEYVAGTFKDEVSGTDAGINESLFLSGELLGFRLDQGETLTISFDVKVSYDALIGDNIENTVTVFYFDPLDLVDVVKSDTVQARVEVIPEPVTLIFFGVGLLGLLVLVRRRRNRRK